MVRRYGNRAARLSRNRGLSHFITLVEPLVDDSRRQFIRLMTKYERMVYGYILSLVPNWADADEILQETNIRLWEEFEKFQLGTNFAAWAIRVAHFQVLTWRKKASRSRLVFDQRVVDSLAAEPCWTDEEFEARQQRTCSLRFRVARS